ncbi:hypothetical protein N7519_000609 [Penicillium mononematosum]|uniref:uncharacterized protein n=1 Tax=Penicillium mononematosum TaxID=268346 RepID=UPI0025490526|nr:uncharacterized protein N7519_000609 [Penicillium mononematosum]KAJ6190588.1 hypothetical protein N7519_000609 [Penicillium mononematosum]
MSIYAFIGGKPGDTPKDSMKETGNDAVYSPSGSSNIVRADIVACGFTFQALVIKKCNRSSEESAPKAFMYKRDNK